MGLLFGVHARTIPRFYGHSAGSDQLGDTRMAETKLPDKIGSYQIRRMLATGTMGDVYQGSTVDPRTKTPVYLAIKVLNPKTARRLDYLARFKSEIKDDHLLEYKEVEYDSKF